MDLALPLRGVTCSTIWISSSVATTGSPQPLNMTHKAVVGASLAELRSVIDVPAARIMVEVDDIEKQSSGRKCRNGGIMQPEQNELFWKQVSQGPTGTNGGRESPQCEFSQARSLQLQNQQKHAWVDPVLPRWNGPQGFAMRAPAGIVNRSTSSTRNSTVEEPLSETVEMLDLLVQRGSFVSTSLLYRILKRCMGKKDLVLGRCVHALALKCGYESNSFLANHFICMYASHGCLDEAMQVFTKVAAPDTHMWASIVLGHARNGQPREAIKLYREMRDSTVKPDNHIFVAILKACASAGDLALGKEVHAQILESSDECNIFVGNCLVDMYAKCGSLRDARAVFDALHTKDVVTWNVMISGYVQHGMGEEALGLYASMLKQGVTLPSRVTFTSLLRACSCVGDVHQGRELHSQIRQRGLEADPVVGSCLVDMYSKCGSLQAARRLFDRMPTKDVVIWTAMISGYVQQGLGQEALTLYASMLQNGITPADGITFACLLKACGSVGGLHQGKQLHAQIEESGLVGHVLLGNCLVDMYAKCGSLEDARRVFNSLPTRDVVTWTTLLNGYAQHSDCQMAIQCFEEMRQQGIHPNGTTFICLLVACSHEGLVNEGQHYFRVMVEDYGIAPTAYHYTCMVDLLGRSGCLNEAESMLRSMPFENDVVGWTSLLSACKSHGDVERGRRCFDHLVAMEPEISSSYVLLANIYASTGRWIDVDTMESLRKSAGAKKKPGKAFIEVKKTVHEFTVGEERTDISFKSGSMNMMLKGEGHVPHTELVLKAVANNEKEGALCGHAEKLALAYGLLNTAGGTPLLVTKNLRMCNDCHSATKVMSRLEKRDIVVRDSSRVHRFVNGSCSCRDRH